MSWTGTYRWLFSLLGLTILRRSLRYRVRNDVQLTVKDLPAGVRMVNRVDFILDFCTGKRVLHVGFADHPFTEERIKDGSLLHLQLKKVTSALVGLDNEADAISKYISLTGDQDLIDADLSSLDRVGFDSSSFDVVLLGEVLEHLPNPSQIIESMSRIFSSETFFLVTVPNYTSLDSFAGSLNEKESVHPDHYYYFSPYTLLKLFPDARFELQQLVFGMYFQMGKKINFVLRRFPFAGDCIIGVFKLKN